MSGEERQLSRWKGDEHKGPLDLQYFSWPLKLHALSKKVSTNIAVKSVLSDRSSKMEDKDKAKSSLCLFS
jgi:hypothetical protein